MNWIILSLIVMISVALIQVILKKDVGKTHTIDFTRSLYTYAFLFTIPFILFTDFKTIPLEYYEVLFAGSIFNILAVVNLFRAIKYLGIGKAVPLSNLELVITLILSTLIFNETLSIIGIIGVLTIFLGAYTLQTGKKTISKRKKRYYSYVLLAALFYSLSSLTDRLIMKYLPNILNYQLLGNQYIVLMQGFMFINYWIIYLTYKYYTDIKNHRNVKPLKHYLKIGLKRDNLIIIGGLIIMIYRLSQALAISTAPALIYVIAIKRMNPLLSEMMAFKLFHETEKMKKLLSTIIIIIGGYIIMYSLI